MNIIKSLQRDMVQYGLVPEKFQSRVLSSNAPKVLANSIPKSGTNMLLRLLYLMPSLYRPFHRTIVGSDSARLEKTLCAIKNAQALPAHLYYSNKAEKLINDNKIKNIIIIRDPRDIAVSNYIYITYKDKSHRLHKYFKYILKNDTDRLLASINGISSELLGGGEPSLGLGKHLDNYLGWLSVDNCLVVRYEELVGDQGGGDNDESLRKIFAVAEFLEIDVSESNANKILNKLYSNASRTFNKGKIGGWKAVFEERHVNAFENNCGDAIKKMGYSW